MKIIVDNGGSKSDWLILPSNEIFSFDGINFFKNPQELNNEFKKIINHLNIGKEKVILEFYTAGFSESLASSHKFMIEKEMSNIKINFYSDMLLASKSSFNDNQSGISCILGTGSNCAYYDGKKNNIITPSLGYIFSDEGSGYDLGRRLLTMFFNDKLNSNINFDIRNHAKTPKNELLNKIYKLGNPKKFISTFSFVVKKNEKNALIDDLIKKSFISFLHNHPFTYPDFRRYKFGFVGSVAFNFRKQLESVMNDENLNFEIIQSPIEKLSNDLK